MKRRFLIVLVLAFLALAGLWRLSSLRNFQIMGKAVSRVWCSEKVVALTFDDGPTPEFVDEVLATLSRCHVKATFFVTGREVETNLAAAQKIVAAGHELGNHSYSHPRMIFKLPETIRNELEKTDVAIRSAGFTGQINFRPPYGKRLVILPWFLEKMGKTTIMWDIEPETYPQIAASADLITEHIISKVQPGSIVLLHVMYTSRAESRKALSMVIEKLRDMGYRFATVNELLQIENSVSDNKSG